MPMPKLNIRNCSLYFP